MDDLDREHTMTDPEPGTVEAPAALVTIRVPVVTLRAARHALSTAAADYGHPETYRQWYSDAADSLRAVEPVEDTDGEPPQPVGRFVHLARRPHTCRTPGEAHWGDVWECECRRRWLCTISAEYTHTVAGGASWMRWPSWLPWPWPW